MRYVLMVIAATCALSFSWARRSFFVRSVSTPPLRKGLGPLGTLFGAGILISLAIDHDLKIDLRTAISLVLFLSSQAVFWLSVRAFGSSRPSIAFSSDTPQRLVTNGPYRYIRHPFYTSYSLFWLAGALAAPNWVTLISVPVMTTLYYLAARGEEESLSTSELGAVYSDYRDRTGMFVPRMCRLR